MSSENQLVNLRDQCIVIQYGYTATASEDPIGPKFLRGTDIKTGFINWINVPYCKIDENEFEKYKLNIGDIVITRMGSPGDSAIVEKNIYSVFASYLIRIRLNDFFYPKYVFYFLQSKKYKDYIKSIISTSATPGVNAKGLTDIEILRIPLQEQKAIAKVLSDLDDKIELNNEMNKTLEEIGQALFKRWFIDFEFPNENGNPYRASGGEMVYSEELGKEIPKGWKVGKLGDIVSIKSGERPKSKKETKDSFFNVPLIGASKIMGYVDMPLFNERILVIGRVGTHGIVQRVESPSYPSDNTLVINSEYYEYTYFILKDIDYSSLNIGTTQPLITQTSVKNYDILIPSKSILKLFEDLNQIVFQLANENKIQNEILSQIRDTLLPKLMSGEIRVSLEAAQ